MFFDQLIAYILNFTSTKGFVGTRRKPQNNSKIRKKIKILVIFRSK